MPNLLWPINSSLWPDRTRAWFRISRRSPTCSNLTYSQGDGVEFAVDG